jgi:hypothetical protein
MARKMNPTPDPIPGSDRTDRAQPGDVLGVERDGKRTHLGDDAEDEDEELEEAEDELLEQQDHPDD